MNDTNISLYQVIILKKHKVSKCGLKKNQTYQKVNTRQ